MTKVPARNHQFDLLRIVFATLVILAHAPELTDGSNSREILCRLTHSEVSFGKLGVDGFFLLSAFLIVKSWQQKPKLTIFLRNRLLRIIPGYLVAALLSTLAVGLLAPGIDHFFRHLDMHFVKSIVAIGSPSTPPVFPGKPHFFAVVNGALWTIQYEFRCYLMVALFGLCGLLHRRLFWLSATAVALAAMISPLNTLCHWSESLYALIGDPTQIFRLTAVYFVGGCFYLYRDRIQFRPRFAVLSFAAIICVRYFDPARIEVAIVVFGGYLMFYFGQLSIRSLAWMKNVPDISYGIYVYGWPVLTLWIWFRHGSPWVAFYGSTVICFILGWLSWHFVESPALSLKHKSFFSKRPGLGQESLQIDRPPMSDAPRGRAIVARGELPRE